MSHHRAHPVAALLLLLLTACSHVIGRPSLDAVTPDLVLAAVKADPAAHAGQILLLGGVILDNAPGANLSTLEIYSWRLDRYGEPVAVDEAAGRFLATSERFLDPALYQPGRLVTLTARVDGHELRPLGELTYDYPLLRIVELYLWRNPYPYRSGYLSPWYYYYGPTWYQRDNPYDPAYMSYPYTPHWGRPLQP
ncbi:MAG: hypothetical protein A2091_09510 [Desulfuromonadales bacterium GWD2_61_12]|nr:MAG: hypothetical protein A2005_12800 [Desulfuromonadales bacterium GWC2_61_20]OGR33345.1 MAG: hypothetical protein A2091_09510 [Desulfuromonadales bacterium GWD2_61_12]HAD04193.1 hypothetical protein [Desulfuromonas sp.]HBT83436.1 hypothetical protein [Desulfuromonas sp.]